MRLLYISFFVISVFLFTGCAKDALVKPISELEAGKSDVTSLTVSVYDRSASEHSSGSCESTGTSTGSSRIGIPNATVEVYFSESDFLNRNSPERAGTTDLNGRIQFSNLIMDRHFIHVSNALGEAGRMAPTPKGKHTTVAIGL